MAIKFRCRHCKQFLGISLARAGSVVDCPQCGRTIRVPDLDGRVRPLPSPQLDLDDSGLVKALHEVAKIGGPPSTETMEVLAATPRVPKEVIEPIPLPEPPPLDPPQPIEMAPQPKAVTIDEPTESPQPNVQHDMIAELAQLAEVGVHSNRRVTARDDAMSRTMRQLTAPIVLLVIASTALLSLGLGILVGRLTSSGPASVVSADGASRDAAANGAPVANPHNSTASIRGRISFKSQSGDSSPDAGSKVIVLPLKAIEGNKLPIAGFRPTAGSDETQAAKETIRKLGGDLAVADDSGNFEMKLPGPGTYPVLVLSRSQRRDKEKPIDANVKQQLDSYFENAESLLGEVRFHFSRIRYRGGAAEVWDHSFEGE